jgi:tRNA-dihydrouridine synthase
LRHKLAFGQAERPIVAQLFSASPERMEKAAALVQELGFDGVDINMGCPVDEVVKSGCGSGMIKNPPLAREIIRAAKRGAPDLPVSVKTRIGFNTDELDTWLPELLAEDLAAVTIHARTRKEMSAVPAHWDAVLRAVAIRDRLGSKTLIVGNGDVKDIAHAKQRVGETGCDGVMLGRAIYGNPWLFSELHKERASSGAPLEASREMQVPSPKEKLAALLEHMMLFDELMTGFANFAVMKKHFKAYVNGWDNAKELRVLLMETDSVTEALAVVGHAQAGLDNEEQAHTLLSV